MKNMTTVFHKNLLEPMTNGVVPEQFSNCTEISTKTLSTTAHSAISDTLIKEEAIETDMRSLEEVVEVKEEPAESIEPVLDITINNVVCSFSVGCHIKLKDIAQRGINVEFRKESGMVTMKLRKPRITASIWSSGKISCTGATSEDESKLGARRIARVIQKLGFDAKFRKMRVVNVLGTCLMPFEIRILAFSQRHREAEYEPELHPGVTYKVKDLKATLKIFSTGSITVTAPSVANVELAIHHIYPLVCEFRKEPTNRDATARKRVLAEHLYQQEKFKRKRLNSNGCSSNEDDDKDIKNVIP